MPINFLKLECRTQSSDAIFGLCDDPPPPNKPAYISETNPENWIAKINNTKKENVLFYAIDHCVSILKADGNPASKCDGVLVYSNNLTFVELKSRKSKKWFKEGREQLTATINQFKQNHDLSTYTKVEAYVCNNLRPLAHSGQAVNIQKFKDDTGYILKGKMNIDLS